MNKNNEIMKIILDVIDTSKEKLKCDSNEVAINEIFLNEFNSDITLFLQYIMENMSMSKFNEIKWLDDEAGGQKIK